MKSKDQQNIVLLKYEKGDTSTEIHRHLNGENQFSNDQKVASDDSPI